MMLYPLEQANFLFHNSHSFIYRQQRLSSKMLAMFAIGDSWCILWVTKVRTAADPRHLARETQLRTEELCGA